MPVHRTPRIPNLPGVSARFDGVRVLPRLVAILALVLQLLAPSLVSASNGEWVEICSEYGVVLQQVDMSEDERSPGKGPADCLDCTFCALAAPMSPPTGPVFELTAQVARQAARLAEPVAMLGRDYAWPASRGPPVRSQLEFAERESRTSAASFQFQGGAL